MSGDRKETKKEEDDVIWFPQGLIGFPGLNRFRIVRGDEENPFALLQSVDRKSMRFPLINPLMIRPDYEIALSPEEIEELEIESRADVAVYAVAVVPPGSDDITLDLRAPLLISRTNNVGVQVLLPGENLPVAASLAAELRREEVEMVP